MAVNNTGMGRNPGTGTGVNLGTLQDNGNGTGTAVTTGGLKGPAAPVVPQYGNSGQGNSTGTGSDWYSGLTTYGTSGSWNGYSSSQNQADYTSADSFSHTSDFDKSGGLAYLDSAGSTAIDKSGTVYIKVTSNTGDVGWMPYQNGKNYAGGVTNGDQYKTGTSNGYTIAGAEQQKDGHYLNSDGSWDNTTAGNQAGTINAASGAYDTISKFQSPTSPPDGSTVAVPTSTDVATASAPVTPPGINPVNHDFINGLQQNIQSGDGAATQQAQAQATTNSNQMRLAAGADTLHGNYAAAGAAGQAESALSGNDQVLSGNTAQAKQTQQDEGMLGQALTQESTQSLSGDAQAVDQQITNISDEMDSIRNAIKGSTDAQSLQIQATLNDLTNKINDYKNAQGKQTLTQQQQMQVIQTILSGAGSLGALLSKGATA